MVARATASRSIKSNLRLSEVIAEPSIEKNRQKVRAIIHMHLQRRWAEKMENPGEISADITFQVCLCIKYQRL